jgi:hypothetical protein
MLIELNEADRESLYLLLQGAATKAIRESTEALNQCELDKSIALSQLSIRYSNLRDKFHNYF